MECDDVAPRLGPSMDGELPPAEEWQVQEHLDTCHGCRGKRDLLLATQAALRSVPCDGVSPGFEAGLQRRLELLAVRDARRAPRRSLLVVALGLVAIVLVALFLPSGGDRRLRWASPVGPSELMPIAWAPQNARDCGIGGASARCQIVRPCADAATCGRSVGLDWALVPSGADVTTSGVSAR
jgi:Putative zinc-finger